MTRISLSNQGYAYSAEVLLGGGKQPLLLDSLSGDVTTTVHNQPNTSDLLCVRMVFDDTPVGAFSRNCSMVEESVGLGNYSANFLILENEWFGVEDPELHPWESSSGFFGIGYNKCSGYDCYNRSESPFQTILKTHYNTSMIGLDLNNDSISSFMDIGTIDSKYVDAFEWAPRQIASFPQYHDFIMYRVQFCDIDIMANLSMNWISRVDSASACLTLPGELYDNLLSWLKLSVPANATASIADIIYSIKFPDLSFALSDEGTPLHISFNDLIVPSSDVINHPDAPELLIEHRTQDGITLQPSNFSLCLLSGEYIGSYPQSSTPTPIVLGSLALRSFYFGVDFDENNARVGFANKKSPESTQSSQCAAQTACYGAQFFNVYQNNCRNPDCRKYFFTELNTETYYCEYDYGSMVVGLLFIVIFATWEIIAFFVGQYNSYILIPKSSRKFSVDPVTLNVGAFLTMVVDALLKNVLCWVPDENLWANQNGNVQEDVSYYDEVNHTMLRESDETDPHFVFDDGDNGQYLLTNESNNEIY